MESYGYTLPVEGTTRIILHRDYTGFPENLDPEGSVRGAAKVSIAHELKHASQFAASRWSEGGWLEADATWAEDLVFDETDDYLRYLPEGSPVSHPGTWLARGASYEDCLWQHLIAERHGVAALVGFFERRTEQPGEPVMSSFDQTLRAYGSTVGEEATQLGLWSYFCGGNATGRPVGFEEAVAYPTPPFQEYLSDPAETVSETLSDLGCHYVFVSGQNRDGRPSVAFSGDRNIPFALHAITLSSEGTRSVHEIPVAGSDSEPTEVPADWDGLPFLVIAVSNLDGSGPADDYFLSVDDDNAVGVEPLASGVSFALEPNRPNPFRLSTEISFSLPVGSAVRLAIYDVTGRMVQRILEGERLPAGRHERRWDGIDQSGRGAAPGVYYYRLEAGEHSATRRLLLLR
jgi:hypothetical protein